MVLSGSASRCGVIIAPVVPPRLYREDPMLGLLFTFGLAMTISRACA